METQNSTPDLHALISATSGELYSLLGASSIAIESPGSVLKRGREGVFWQSQPAVMGTDVPFEHLGLQTAGKKFISEWGNQLQQALCGNQELYKEEQTRGIHDVDLFVGSVFTAITVSIPLLAPFTPLVTILAVIVVKTGLRAFCASLGQAATTK